MKFFNDEEIVFIETSQVTDGVTCDVYFFKNSSEKDLGIIKITDGFSTPRQKVMLGDRTIEGVISGKGSFILERDGIQKKYQTEHETFKVELKRGDIMQWIADKNSDMICYEVCFPAYKEGRFLNI